MEKKREGREHKKRKKGTKKKKENECENRKAGKGKSIVQTNVESSKTLDVALVIDHTHTHDDTHVIVMGRGVGKVLRYDTAVRTLRSFFIRENIRLTLLENGEHICPWTAIIVIVIGIEQD